MLILLFALPIPSTGGSPIIFHWQTTTFLQFCNHICQYICMYLCSVEAQYKSIGNPTSCAHLPAQYWALVREKTIQIQLQVSFKDYNRHQICLVPTTRGICVQLPPGEPVQRRKIPSHTSSWRNPSVAWSGRIRQTLRPIRKTVRIRYCNGHPLSLWS